MTFYFLCPDTNAPTGGIKVIYRLVDTLNRLGWSAAVLHQTQGFRCTWFENDVPVIDWSAGVVQDAVLVFPEIYAANIPGVLPGVPKIVFNQNAYNTFAAADWKVYRNPDVVGVVVVSEDNKKYLEYAFPDLYIDRITLSVDTNLFVPGDKTRTIAFMPRKNARDAEQVLGILGSRQALESWTVTPVHDMSETEVARILGEAMIYLSFGYPEGFGLPSLEAMACGCLVIGHHGEGGREFWRPEWSISVPIGNIVEYARTVERLLGPLSRLAPLQSARNFVQAHYSSEHFVRSVEQVWTRFSQRISP